MTASGGLLHYRPASFASTKRAELVRPIELLAACLSDERLRQRLAPSNWSIPSALVSTPSARQGRSCGVTDTKSSDTGRNEAGSKA